MRRRAWIAIGLVGLGFLLGAAGRETEVAFFSTLGGFSFVVAIGLFVSLLPFWVRLRDKVPPMPGLFPVLRASERWCTRCGSPTGEAGPCRVCGHQPREGRPPKAPKAGPPKGATPRGRAGKKP